jgi:hypothetical protein
MALSGQPSPSFAQAPQSPFHRQQLPITQQTQPVYAAQRVTYQTWVEQQKQTPVYQGKSPRDVPNPYYDTHRQYQDKGDGYQ